MIKNPKNTKAKIFSWMKIMIIFKVKKKINQKMLNEHQIHYSI
jgi:hypothetical protein